MILAALAAIAPFTANGQVKPTVTVINPVTNPVNAHITNTVVPVEVSNADPIAVSDTLGPGRSPRRFGPVSFNNAGTLPVTGPEVVPAVPAGQIFVVTSLHATISSFLGQSLSDAQCSIQLRTENDGVFLTVSIARLPMDFSAGSFFGNLQLSLPLSAGESLRINCIGTPGPLEHSQGGRLTATGYYLPAT